MMWVVLAGLLTTAAAIAISPLIIVAVILMATAGKGRTNGTAFLLGFYVFAVVLVALIVLWGREAGAEVEGSESHLTMDILQIVLGLALLVLAYLQWRKRGADRPPKWMERLDNLNLWQAFVLGGLISVPLSPKDLPLLISAGGKISQAPLTALESIGVIAIFGVLCVLAAAIPWVMSVISPKRVGQQLAGSRAWLLKNHTVIMLVLFLILGVKLIGTGLVDLLLSSDPSLAGELAVELAE